MPSLDWPHGKVWHIENAWCWRKKRQKVMDKPNSAGLRANSLCVVTYSANLLSRGSKGMSCQPWSSTQLWHLDDNLSCELQTSLSFTLNESKLNEFHLRNKIQNCKRTVVINKKQILSKFIMIFYFESAYHLHKLK